ncbi:PAS domain S-box protein [Stappia sp. F7233]|uniref:PAS domain S-box protein n=1 Tax=Stappia albiluteola TaxID=2758565 RepID=A0A839ABG1_9HYPH|nr:PAS domain-containing protein [Stappia albiluteola]MBA5776933.1 PAS domain S-box protein [Stappia albiluteola]
MVIGVNAAYRIIRNHAPNKEAFALLDAVGAYCWAYDPLSEELSWQQRDADSPLGYRVLKIDVKKALLRYDEPDRLKLLRVLTEALENGLSNPAKVKVNTESGPSVYEIVGSRTASRQPPLVVGLMRDCTQDPAKYAYLIGLQQVMGSLLSSLQKAALIVDRNGVIKSANKAFLRTFGIADARQLIGRDVRTIPNHLGKTLSAKFTTVLSGGTVAPGTAHFLLSSGKTIDMEFQIHAFALDKPFGGVAFLGESIKANQGIEAVELLDSIPTPILVADLNSRRIIYANKTGKGELGLSLEQVGKERLSDRLMSEEDIHDLVRVLDTIGWDLGRVWQIDTHHGLKRHYRIRTCFQGDPAARRVVLEFLPAKLKSDEPANEKARGFFARLAEFRFG